MWRNALRAPGDVPERSRGHASIYLSFNTLNMRHGKNAHAQAFFRSLQDLSSQVKQLLGASRTLGFALNGPLMGAVHRAIHLGPGKGLIEIPSWRV